MFTGMKIIMDIILCLNVCLCGACVVAWFCESIIRFPRSVLPVPITTKYWQPFRNKENHKSLFPCITAYQERRSQAPPARR